MLIISGLPWAV